MKKTLFFLWIITACLCTGVFASSSHHINVDADTETGAVNRRVFGGNFVGYDPVLCRFMSGTYYGHSDFGAGVWDPKRGQSAEQVIELAKGAGLAVLRFPGGCGSHLYDWKKGVGKNREHFLYGLDEFLKTCKEVGAEPIITVSYFIGNEQDAADLVEYLNFSNDGSNFGGGVDWAAERVKNGHEEPYHVKFFEIGNEEDHGDHQRVKSVSPEAYGERYLKYYHLMKSMDPSIQIGAVLRPKWWNEKVCRIIKENLDYAIVHVYPKVNIGSDRLNKMDPEKILRDTLGIPVMKAEDELRRTLKLLKKESGKDVPLALTEYNIGFVEDEPVSFRHTLGAALLNAELIKIFLKPENNVLMANYWQFVNEYWGMVANNFDGTEGTLNKPYFKRPNYYVFELYRKYFGSVLIKYSVDDSDLSVNVSKSAVGDKVYMMVVNKNVKKSISAQIVLNGFAPARQGESWILNGPKIVSTNEKDPDNVKLTPVNFEIGSNRFEYAFEPHSLTAIIIDRANGDAASK